MPTYRSTARNQLRTPLGAVGDPPDVPGYLSTFADDVDNILGVGGAEAIANQTAFAAIPAGRLFKGKLVYRTDLDTVYRYVGVGATALGSADSTHAWQAWTKPPTVFTPAFQTLTPAAGGLGIWGISDGLLWVSAGCGVSAITSTTADVTMTSPGAFVAPLGAGSGQYQKGGSTANNNQVELACYGIGSSGLANTVLRIRARLATAAGAAVTGNVLGSVITAAASDSLQVHYSGPSAAVL